MKNVVLSADTLPTVYLVPDEVADNLKRYCLDFVNWWNSSPQAKKYHRRNWGYNEEDFIRYLNRWIFPYTPSEFIEKLDWIDSEENLPEKYKGCEWFNF